MQPFPSSPGPLYQNEVKCSAFDMGMIFHSRANTTHFHKKGCALGLILKMRGFSTRKWPITVSPNVGNKSFFFLYSQEIYGKIRETFRNTVPQLIKACFSPPRLLTY